jgi:ABC-type Zn2+ transport system substrate-binding protein/surface adhesin
MCHCNNYALVLTAYVVSAMGSVTVIVTVIGAEYFNIIRTTLQQHKITCFLNNIMF